MYLIFVMNKALTSRISVLVNGSAHVCCRGSLTCAYDKFPPWFRYLATI